MILRSGKLTLLCENNLRASAASSMAGISVLSHTVNVIHKHVFELRVNHVIQHHWLARIK